MGESPLPPPKTRNKKHQRYHEGLLKVIRFANFIIEVDWSLGVISTHSPCPAPEKKRKESHVKSADLRITVAEKGGGVVVLVKVLPFERRPNWAGPQYCFFVLWQTNNWEHLFWNNAFQLPAGEATTLFNAQ